MRTTEEEQRSVGTSAFISRFGFRQYVGVVSGPLLAATAVLGGEAVGLDAPQRWTAATVLLMATWWITEPLPLTLTACLPLIVFPLTGVVPLFAVALQYVDPVNFLFLGGMLIAASMQQWGLHRRIALNIIAAIGSSPRRIVLGFMLGTGFLSLWISNTASAVMMYPIAMAVLLKLSERKDHDVVLHRRFGLALMLGIAYAASIGGIGTKIGTAPNLIFVKQAEALLGRDVDFLMWLEVGLPIVLIALPVVWWYLVRIAAPLPRYGFAETATVIAAERSQLGRMVAGERVALTAFLVAALLWIFRKDIELGTITVPGWWRYVTWSWADVIGRPLDTLPAALAKLLAQDIGDAAVAMAVGGGLLLLPVSLTPLRCALSPARAVRVRWPLLVLLGGGFAMAHGVQQSGLSAWMGGLLAGVGEVPPLVTVLVACMLTLVLTEVASNTATASILLPLVAAIAPEVGMHPAPLMMAVAIAASFGLMLPAGTPPNAVAFSSGYITVPQMARCGLLVDLFGVLLVTLVCYFLAPWALRLM